MSEFSASAFVQSMYARLGTGDIAGARGMWADGAVWHLTGSPDLAGDYDPDAYFEVLGNWAALYPSYAPEFKEVRDIGEDVALIYMESNDGMAPGPASGLLIFRVVGGHIVEGWAIPTFARGHFAF